MTEYSSFKNIDIYRSCSPPSLLLPLFRSLARSLFVRAHTRAEFLDSAPAADADAQAFFSPTQRARLAVLMKDVLSTMQ
jgi:hypothetical protein